MWGKRYEKEAADRARTNLRRYVQLERYAKLIRDYHALLDQQRGWLHGLALGTDYLERLNHIRFFLDGWMLKINHCQNGIFRHTELSDVFRPSFDVLLEYLEHAPISTKTNVSANTSQHFNSEEVDELLSRLFASVQQKGFEMIESFSGGA